MDGVRPGQIHARRICEALVEEPGKVWSSAELAQVSGCGVRTADRVVRRLWLAGAVDHVRDPIRPVEPASTVYRRDARGSRQLRAAEDGQVIRDLLARGRPRSVIGMLVWEGPLSATALWQAKRKNRSWRRRNEAEPPAGGGHGDGANRASRLAEGLASLYRRFRWYWYARHGR